MMAIMLLIFKVRYPQILKLKEVICLNAPKHNWNPTPWLAAFWLTCFIIGCSSLKHPPLPEETTSPARPITDLHVSMYQIATNVLKLQTYAVSEQKFQDPKNRGEIRRLINSLGNRTDHLLREKEIQNAGYRISGNALERHIYELKQVYLASNFAHARALVLATPTACAACHAQLPNSPTPLWQLSKADVAGTPLEQAELLYATRNFDAALNLYNEIIRSPNVTSPSDIKLAFQRKLTILFRLKRDFKAAQRSLSIDEKNAKLPTYLVEDLAEWQKAIRNEIRTHRLAKAGASNSALLAEAENVFLSPSMNAPAELIAQLYVSGLLYEALHKAKRDDKTQELLFWLGTADETMNNDIFYGISFAYFRECIDKDSSTKIAKECFRHYEANTMSLYSGNRGYELPIEIEDDLKQLRTRVGLDQL